MIQFSICLYNHIRPYYRKFCNYTSHLDLLMYAKVAMNQKKKIRMLTTTNSNITLHVLGNGADGAPSCLFVSTDHLNYMFNCGEGCQRLAHEYHLKLCKLDHVFVTRPIWKNIGGLPGMLLTLQETGLIEINIHGPDKIYNFLNGIKEFISVQHLNISYKCADEFKPHKDKIMNVQYIPITKSLTNVHESSSELVEELVVKEDEYSSNINGKRIIDGEANKNFAKEEKKLKTSTNLICYICELKPKQGKLIMNKCLKYGINPGPHLKLLKDGVDITTASGTVVTSSDVCLPQGPTNTFIVVDCPTHDYLDSLVNHSAFSKYQMESPKENENEIFYIFHFTPEEIFNDPKYQDWIKKFPCWTNHIILNNRNSINLSKAVFKNQCLLNMLHSEIFPILNTDFINNNKEIQDTNICYAKTMQGLRLLPRVKRIEPPPLCLESNTYTNEVLNIPQFQETFEKLKADIEATVEKYNLTNSSKYPRIVMLGTGSSVPNKIRNTSSILFRLDENTSILMDCGEGTLNQIIKFYGNSKCDEILLSIKAIYVSHMHTDHHMGLINILLRRQKCASDKVFVLAPLQLDIWLKLYHNKFEAISHTYNFISNHNFYFKNHKNNSVESELYDLLNIKQIDTIFVKHCKYSYGVAITLKDDKKIVYSGDTMPSPNLIYLGKDCDLLIHEATLEDVLETLAKQKCHSTTSQAIEVGKLMHAKFILLTHFSQRYAKIPIISKEENVGVAFDNMNIGLSELPLLPLFYPCLQLIFQNDINLLKKRAFKRMHRM